MSELTIEELIDKLKDLGSKHGLGLQTFTNIGDIRYDGQFKVILAESEINGLKEEIRDLEDEVVGNQREIYRLHNILQDNKIYYS